MEDYRIVMFISFIIVAMSIVYYGGVLHYNKYYGTLIRAYEAGYLKKLIPKYLYLFGGWFSTAKTIQNIAKNIPGNKNIEKEIKGYKISIKGRNFSLLLLFIGILLPVSFVHFECSRYLPLYYSFDWRIEELLEKLFSFIDDSTNYLPLISLFIVTITATISGIKQCKHEDKILNFINDSCDEKLKARDILASHQTN